MLFVNSEIFPYLPHTRISDIGRYLPQGIQERKKEIRSFMPRYGCINERRNQLHEVIPLRHEHNHKRCRPASGHQGGIGCRCPHAGYFIDNEDYFHRKHIYHDADGKFFPTTGKAYSSPGVLETVKKLRWASDIIHCHGWISYVLPAYHSRKPISTIPSSRQANRPFHYITTSTYRSQATLKG